MLTKEISEKFTVSTLSDYYELTKPGITFTVLASMLIGFLLGTTGSVDYLLMAHALLGTWLIAAGTAAHNMFLERGLDGLMHRTSKRPLPDSRVSPSSGFMFSIVLIISGSVYLLFMVNLVAGIVSIATTVIYLWMYTPLKRISALNVFVGAVPGALPVVGGWAAASGTVFEHGMWILFGIIYCWQIPHVMSIAWVCRKDYEHAGFQMLPKHDTTGITTSIWMLLPMAGLFASVYKLWVMDYMGWIFLAAGMILSAGYLWYAIRFAVKRDIPTAKSLMFSSFAYLPLIWIIVFVDWVLM